MKKNLGRVVQQLLAVFVAGWLVVMPFAPVLAQDTTGAPTDTGAPSDTGAPANTGAPDDTGAPSCTGAGCGQGADQGVDQGTGQGGTSKEALGVDDTGHLLPGVTDTRQGAQQGATNGVTVENNATGAGSTNNAGVSTNATGTTSASNTATDTTALSGTASTGGNTSNSNTGVGGVTTGNAGIGVTQVKNDNTTTINGGTGVSVSGYSGDVTGTYAIPVGASSASLSGADGNHSIQAVNNTTGSDSDNAATIDTKTKEITEVQNDGVIENLLDLLAVTGQNQTNKNTGGGSIETGDADVAATLVNLLNTTVINGNLWVSVADIFGDVFGDITLPSFAELAALLPASSGTAIDASNEHTGEGSTNTIDIDTESKDTTAIDNDATITTTVNAKAITGQNEAEANTGGAAIETGDGSVTASNITVANTTIEGGNWMLVIVNALNGWFGFLVGENGSMQALSHDETLNHIAAANTNTGSDSTNTIDVNAEEERATTIDNDATITNEINATAITGQNQAHKNTGEASITTGDASIEATTINLANTTVKDGSLLITVVNILGDFWGDLLQGGQSLFAAAATQNQKMVDATNSNTGANSTNTIDITSHDTHEMTIDNDATIATTLNADIDTGSNKSNRNTDGASITTGSGILGLHTKALANITGLGMTHDGLSVTVNEANEKTGFNSENTINAKINSDRIVTITNDALISTLIPALINTGNNEMSQNTVSGAIVTGDAAAHIALDALVNTVLALAADGNLDIDATLLNRLTGAKSTNENTADVIQTLAAFITNNGLVQNLVNLLLNTGGNTAHENTAGGGIFSGAACVEGSSDADINTVSGLTGSVTLNNNAAAQTNADITAQTGNNSSQSNTAASTDTDTPDGACAQLLSQAPTPTPTPMPSPTPSPNGGGTTTNDSNPSSGGGDSHDGGDDQGTDETVKKAQGGGLVAGTNNHGGSDSTGIGGDDIGFHPVRTLLKRFPVAGGERAHGFVAYMISAVALLAGSVWMDRRVRLELDEETV